jgi:hypothetical protein
MQVEAVVTKDELQHLTFLCKSEIDSIGRITAGIIRLLKLEGSVGQSVIDQLGNLGMFPKFFFFDSRSFLFIELFFTHQITRTFCLTLKSGSDGTFLSLDLWWKMDFILEVLAFLTGSSI